MYRLTIKSLAIFVLLFSINSYAEGTSSGGGVLNTYVISECKGQLESGMKVDLEIRSILNRFVQAVLVDADSNDLVANIYCDKGGDIVAGTPSAGQLEWQCGQTALDQPTDGGFLIEVTSGGVIGKRLAQVSLKQMSPLPAKPIGSLFCN